MARPDWLRFPRTVDDTATRVTAAGVTVIAVSYLATRWSWLLVVLTYGFAARVFAGATFSPLARLARDVVGPRIRRAARPIAGPPKRFAQLVGLIFSASSALAASVFGAVPVAVGLVAVLTVFAFLEAAVGFCMGCTVFAWLMKVGVIPATVCIECSDIWSRLPSADVAG